MGRLLLVFSFAFLGYISKAQVSCPTENDALTSQVVFVLKDATTAQLNAVKTEFAKYPQIIKANYVYTSLNYLLVDLDMNLNNPRFVRYADLIKTMRGAFAADKILIKAPSSYSDIAAQSDSNTFVVK